MVDGESDERELRAVARARIAQGLLPEVNPQRTWGGPGGGSVCALCDRVVTATEIEFELQFPPVPGPITLHFHRQCHALWEAERRPRLETWTAIADSLPPPGQPVEGRLRLAEGRTIILDLRRELPEGGSGAVWINMTSGQPVPASWTPIEWRPHAPASDGALDGPGRGGASRKS